MQIDANCWNTDACTLQFPDEKTEVGAAKT